jgi:hypothetical protein
MHNIRTNFIKILQVIKDIIGVEINEKGSYLRLGTWSKFSNIEVIALSLTAGCLSIDSENYLFSKFNSEYLNDFENLISRWQYKDRRKLLFEKTEEVRKSMAERINKQADIFAIDSMPLEICKISREQRNKMGKESAHHYPDIGYCASQKKYFYGYNLHSVCSAAGVIHSLDLTRASVHDVRYLKDVKELFNNCMIIGVKGYISRQHQINLFETAGIELEVPLRSNQKEQKPTMWVLKTVRKIIETVFPQLCNQFMMQRNYAKSFTGFKYRVLAKVTGLTVLQALEQIYIQQTRG